MHKNCEITNGYYFKPLNVWCFVTLQDKTHTGAPKAPTHHEVCSWTVDTVIVWFRMGNLITVRRSNLRAPSTTAQIQYDIKAFFLLQNMWSVYMYLLMPSKTFPLLLLEALVQFMRTFKTTSRATNKILIAQDPQDNKARNTLEIIQ